MSTTRVKALRRITNVLLGEIATVFSVMEYRKERRKMQKERVLEKELPKQTRKGTKQSL